MAQPEMFTLPNWLVRMPGKPRHLEMWDGIALPQNHWIFLVALYSTLRLWYDEVSATGGQGPDVWKRPFNHTRMATISGWTGCPIAPFVRLLSWYCIRELILKGPYFHLPFFKRIIVILFSGCLFKKIKSIFYCINRYSYTSKNVKKQMQHT